MLDVFNVQVLLRLLVDRGIALIRVTVFLVFLVSLETHTLEVVLVFVDFGSLFRGFQDCLQLLEGL